MQKWEHLLVHVELSEGKLVAVANGKEIIRADGSAGEVDFIKYLYSLLVEEWQMFSAQKNKYGYQIVFFRHSVG